MSSPAANTALRFSSIGARITIAIVVLCVGIGILAALVVTKPELPPKDNAAAALLVGTIPATRADIPRTWTGYGSARTMNAVNLSAQVAARVTQRPAAIEPGLPITSGSLIVQLEQTDYLARSRAADQLVAQAFAELESLDIDETAWQEQLRLAEDQVSIERRELAQALDALENNAASAAEIDRRTKALRATESQASSIRQLCLRVPARRAGLQASLNKLRADADLARENLARTTIASPITGFIQRVDVEQGELLTVGSPVARVVDISRIEIPVKIAASALGYVRIGDPATLRPDAPASHTWTGKIVRVSPEADPATRSLTVFIEVTQDPAAFNRSAQDSATLLLPGQFVVAEITGAPETNRLIVPRRAVQDGLVYLALPNDRGTWTAKMAHVATLFHTAGSFPDIDPIERQWAVLESADIPAGSPIILTNLDVMIDGRIIDIQRIGPTGDVP